MTNSNLLEPLVKGLISYGKWFISAWSDSDRFDFNSYFRTVKLCNKNEQYPRVIKTFEGTKGTVYLITIPVGLNEGDFKAHKESIKAQLKNDIEIRLRNRYIELEVITKKLMENIPYRLPKKIKDSIYIPIGESLSGAEFLDMKHTPHSLICGVTNSGKSVMSKSILTSIVSMYSDNIELVLIDLKRTELSQFKNLSVSKSFTYDPSDAKEVIADILEECNARFSLIEERGFTTVDDYNKSVSKDKKLKNIIVFIEEFILLDDKATLKMLTKIAAISRAANIFLILTCQRFSQSEIPITLRSQIGNRIVHQVVDEANSTLILDSPGAEKIKIKGRAYYKSNSEIKEIQGYYITDEQVRQYTKHLIVKNSHLKAPITVEKVKSNQQVAEQNKKTQNGENKLNDLSFLDIL